MTTDWCEVRRKYHSGWKTAWEIVQIAVVVGIFCIFVAMVIWVVNAMYEQSPFAVEVIGVIVVMVVIPIIIDWYINRKCIEQEKAKAGEMPP